MVDTQSRAWGAGGCDETATTAAEPSGMEPVFRLSRGLAGYATSPYQADSQGYPARDAAHAPRPAAAGARGPGPLGALARRDGAHGDRRHTARQPGRHHIPPA